MIRRRKPMVTKVTGTPGGTGGITGPGNGFTSSPAPSGFRPPVKTPAFNPAGANQPAINASAAPAAAKPVSDWASALAGPSVPGQPSIGSYLDPYSTALKGFAETKRDNAFADITKDAGYGQADYGYTGRDTNGDGIPDSGFTVDPSNPFSKASLLQRMYDQSARGTTNSYAAQGQLYSGALQNAQNENAFQNQQGVNANVRDFSRLMESLSRGRRDASLGASEDMAGIDWQALLAALGRGSS